VTRLHGDGGAKRCSGSASRADGGDADRDGDRDDHDARMMESVGALDAPSDVDEIAVMPVSTRHCLGTRGVAVQRLGVVGVARRRLRCGWPRGEQPHRFLGIGPRARQDGEDGSGAQHMGQCGAALVSLTSEATGRRVRRGRRHEGS
jgi:hypothetical protein